ncbi:hypothetical protein [Streptomyces sp. DH10]|uniref:hypothetical protein n=1 Tax=Streptomyces sp. DH10 TaxID=3040121 RepID=UPI0024426D6A|nr:hypothetical protein [Streptomyces sp. DH10]MDG9710100.1 hypothetical protein [Streptomyces sp. DH10]
MKFVQIIDFETERMDEMERIFGEAERRFTGRPGGPTQRMLLKDRDNPRRYLALIEFDSFEEAMRNSNDPETGRMAEQLGELCIGERKYTNCDLVEQRELA